MGLFSDFGTAGTAWVGTQATMFLLVRLLVMVVLQGINLAGWDVVFLMFNFLLRLFTVGITGWLVKVGIMAGISFLLRHCTSLAIKVVVG